MAAAHVSERVKDTDGVIKYQTVSEDIRENASELWTVDAETDTNSDNDNGNTAHMDKLDNTDSELLQQLMQIYRLLRQPKDDA